jgi:vancomycin permeability regulator SanA
VSQSPFTTQTEVVHKVPPKFARSPSSEIVRWTITLVITLALAIGLLGLSLISAIYLSARDSSSTAADAIVVMGAAQFNGVPSEVLRARLDTAYQAWDDGLAPTIIVTGGKLPGDVYTESEASQMYLMDRGVPEDAILLENEGSNSADSLVHAAEIAKAHNIHDVLVVSDGFHLFRSRMIAEDNGLDALGIAVEDGPIETGSWTEFEYVLREAAAVVAYWFS